MPPVGTLWPVRAFASAAFDQSEISMPHQGSFPPAEVPAARIVAEVSIDLALVADPIGARSRHHIYGGCQPLINPFSQEPQFTPTADACRLQSTCGNFAVDGLDATASPLRSLLDGEPGTRRRAGRIHRWSCDVWLPRFGHIRSKCCGRHLKSPRSLTRRPFVSYVTRTIRRPRPSVQRRARERTRETVRCAAIVLVSVCGIDVMSSGRWEAAVPTSARFIGGLRLVPIQARPRRNDHHRGCTGTRGAVPRHDGARQS